VGLVFNVEFQLGDEMSANPVSLTNACTTDIHRWLKAVLGDDVVPLSVVTTRGLKEGMDMVELWAGIREHCIQQGGINGVHYLKLPKAIWGVSKHR
jgi:hypothetical protein